MLILLKSLNFWLSGFNSGSNYLLGRGKIMKSDSRFSYEKVFLLLTSAMLLMLIFIMPINRVPDELNHARMAWNILFEKTNTSFDWFGAVDPGAEFSKIEYFRLFTSKINFSNEHFALNLTPKSILHFPQLLGMMLGRMAYPSIGVMITLGRFFNALTYIGIGYFGIKNAKFGKSVVFFVMLLPMMLQQAASLSYDVLNFGAILLFYVLLTSLIEDSTITLKKSVVMLIAIFFLYLTKANNLLLVILLAFVGLKLPENAHFLRRKLKNIKLFVKKHRLLMGILLLILLVPMVIFAALFVHYFFKDKGGVGHFILVMFNTLFNNSLNDHLNSILTIGIFGYFGNFQAQLPLWLIFIDVAVFTLLLIQNRPVNVNRWLGWMSGLMFPLQVCAIIAGMYFAWTPIVLGENAIISVGAQGRYFTPFLLYLVFFTTSFKSTINANINSKKLMSVSTGIILFNYLMMLFLFVYSYWI